jgi:hypothetical protein
MQGFGLGQSEDRGDQRIAFGQGDCRILALIYIHRAMVGRLHSPACAALRIFAAPAVQVRA